MSYRIGEFDLAKLDFEGQRKSRRKRLFLRSLPFVVIMIGIAIFFAFPGALVALAKGAADSQHYQRSIQLLTTAEHVALSGQYGVAHNKGVVYLTDKQYAHAKDAFETALGFASTDEQTCRSVRLLVRTMEAWGDSLVGDIRHKTVVIQRYSAALLLVEKHQACIDDTNAKTRIEAKLSAAQAATGEGDDENTDNTEDTPDTSDSQKEELEKRQKESRDHQREGRGTSQPGYVDDLEEDAKPW